MQHLELDICDRALSYVLSCKSLLAFSGGVDSSALYEILKRLGVSFDIAIVNYNTRLGSRSELDYARFLAGMDNRICHVLECNVCGSNFESRARRIRYDFFYSVMYKFDYDNLVLAHHLNDKLEWFLMQFSKGSGLNTILGFDSVEIRHIYSRQIRIVRPLIYVPKSRLLDFNVSNGVRYFIDSTNYDQSHRRNYFRERFSNEMIDRFCAGVVNSFKYLRRSYDMLYARSIFCSDNNLVYFKSHKNEIHDIDRIIKGWGYVLSSHQRSEIVTLLSQHKECVISGRFAIARGEGITYVGMYDEITKSTVLPKRYRDLFRLQRIPPKIRKIMYRNGRSNLPGGFLHDSTRNGGGRGGTSATQKR